MKPNSRVIGTVMLSGWLFLAMLALADPVNQSVSSASATGEFTDSGFATLQAVQNSAVAWGDYDNDNDLDVLLSGWISDTRITDVYRNDGGGNFSPINAGFVGVSSGSVAWGDYDQDGDLDVLLAGISAAGATAKVYRNEGNGVFIDVLANLTGVGISAAAWGDYDNDGDLDILLAGTFYGEGCSYYSGLGYASTQIYRNDGNGVFKNTGASLVGVCAGSVAWGDYDTDGDLDILMTGLYEDYLGFPSASTKLYRNDGDGVWVDVNAPLAAISSGSAVWGDYDADGDPDILLSGNGITKIYRNDGGGLFVDVNAGLSGLSESTTAWGDYDNDGDLDVLLTGLDNAAVPRASVYRNDGNAGFTDIVAGLTGVRDGSAVWGDSDVDGDLDILLTGLTSEGMATTKLYLNGSPIVDTPPSAPTDLQTVTAGATVTLSWAAAIDAQTPSAGLTYNVRMGLTAGGSEILPAMSDLGNGYRRIVYWGNSGEITSAHLRPIPGGTYYWSVQAVDTAFAGSPFSIEGTFSLPTDLSVTVLATPDPVVVGQPLTYTAQVVNHGLSAASNVVLTDVLPADVILGTYSSSQGQCIHPEAGYIVCDLQAVNATSVVTVTLVVTPTTLTTPLTNTVTLATGVPETLSDNNIFTATTGVTPFAFSGFNFIAERGNVAWGDYDNDGDLDLLFINAPPWACCNLTKIFRNDGVNGFADIGAPVVQVSEGDGEWGDYDNDGDLDIVLTGASAGQPTTRIYRNDGLGVFTDIGANVVGVWRGSADWGDVDNDGDLDLFLTGVDATISSIARLYRNDGHDIFTPVATGITGVALSAAAWGDYDNDGDLDIVATGCIWVCPNSDIARVYRNDGALPDNRWLFSDIQVGLPGIHNGSIAWGDYDADGDLDLLMAGLTYGGGITRIYRNNGNDTFTDIQAGLRGIDFGSAAWGDYDNDGDLDVVVPDRFSEVVIYRNDGANSFAPVRTGLASQALVSLVDYDGDADLDMVLDGGQVYRNDAPIHNTPPSAPTGLRLLGLDGLRAVIAWNAANDNQTPASGLNYNLRLGTTPGGTDISTPMADTETGERRVVALGNANQGLTTTFNLAGPGPFFWSVQAIDTAWAGSPFADEASFNVSPTVQFSASHFSVAEQAEAIPVTVTLSSPVMQTVGVSYSTTDSTAQAGNDYLAESGTLTFTPGMTSTTISVPVLDDDIYEGDESFTLTLSAPHNIELGIPHVASLAIQDNESLPIVQLVTDTYWVSETEDVVVFTVNLDHPSAFPVTVTYATSDRTALAGSDYLSATGDLIFTPGSTLVTTTVQILDDAVYEGDESFTLTIADPGNAILGTSLSATITLSDNESLPAFHFMMPEYSVNESTDAALITVALSPTSAFTTTVRYRTDDGTAQSGQDYLPISATLTFTPGYTVAYVMVPLLEDSLYEPPESIILTLSDPDSAQLESPYVTMLTLVDNDYACFLPLVLHG